MAGERIAAEYGGKVRFFSAWGEKKAQSRSSSHLRLLLLAKVEEAKGERQELGVGTLQLFLLELKNALNDGLADVAVAGSDMNLGQGQGRGGQGLDRGADVLQDGQEELRRALAHRAGIRQAQAHVRAHAIQGLFVLNVICIEKKGGKEACEGRRGRGGAGQGRAWHENEWV